MLCLEMLTLLLERPTDDSVEVAISFLKECGLKLTEVSPRGINGTLPHLEESLFTLYLAYNNVFGALYYTVRILKNDIVT